MAERCAIEVMRSAHRRVGCFLSAQDFEEAVVRVRLSCADAWVFAVLAAVGVSC